MAIRIPTYERHVQLDSGAQTLPRFTADTSIGKGLKEAGSALAQVAAHWKAKQDSLDRLQMHQNHGLLQQQIKIIEAEENAKFDPGKDTLGALHERISARVAQAVAAFQANAPVQLRNDYKVYGDAAMSSASNGAAYQENQRRNEYGKSELDKITSQLVDSLHKNPDKLPQTVEQIRKAIKDIGPASGLTDAQRRILDEGYLHQLAKAAAQGFAAQNRQDEGKVVLDQFVKDRIAEEKAQRVPAPGVPSTAPAQPGARQPGQAPQAGQPAGPTGPGPAPKPIQESNIDLSKQPLVKTPEGTATVRSITVEMDGQHIVIPTVTSDGKGGGRIMSDAEAIQRYKDTGQHLGIYGSKADAEKAAVDLHNREAARIGAGAAAEPGTMSADAAARGILPMGQTAATGAAATAGGTDALNAKRIAEIDGKPEIKAAIEKVAAETGYDANLLKVAASIESSGNPKAKSGEHVGLFQLTKAEQGMHGGGERTDPEANTRAFVQVLERNKGLLTTALGRPPTNQELYFSHNQGVGGTIAHIQNPDQPAWKTLLQTSEGQEKGEAWAKAAVKGNVPADVLKRLYGGDETKINSRELMAIKGTQVAGGGIDEAVTTARVQPEQQVLAKSAVVASADGTVVPDTRPTYLGGMNVGARPTEAPTIAGYRASKEFRLDESGAHGFQRGGIKVADWLVDSVRAASNTLPEGYTVKVISTVDPRSTGTPWHPSGRAIDVQIYDPNGKPVPNTGPPSTPGWSLYENMAAAAKAYAEDKHGKNLTWGGHFNTGTPFDRMHFQVGGPEGGGSARSFTPQQIEGGRLAIQTASQPGGGPVQVASADGIPLSRWEQLGVTLNNQLDGSTMKAAAINHAMKVSLQGRVQADIVSTQLNGKGITLPKELQDYYKHPTSDLSFDLIAGKLGTGAAIKWQQDKDYAQKIYNGGANMEDMPRDTILQRLQEIKPDPNSPYYVDQAKVYNEVLKKAQKVTNERNADPAGYADKDPAVAQALEDARKDPQNPEKIQALITARMNRQAQLGIDPALRTPISNEQAKILAQPLLDRARPDRDSAGSEVAQNIVKFVGKATAEGVPDLAHRALQTVLKVKGINDQQAAATADALVTAQHPPPAPLVPSDGKPKNYDLSYLSKDGYFFGYSPELPSYYGRQDEPSDNYADNPPAEAATFQPGTKFIPSKHIEQLLKDPSLADIFDNGSPGRPGYGPGAAKHFLEGGKNTPVSTPLSTPTPEEQKADVLESPVPLPGQPDLLTQPEEQPAEEGTP